MWNNHLYQQMELIPEVESLLYGKLETGIRRTPRCFTPTTSKNPASLKLSPISNLDFNAGSVTILGHSYLLNGSVFYPSKASGTGKPFNTRPTKNGLAPILFFAHGNHPTFHDPKNRHFEIGFPLPNYKPIENHRGYEYFQKILAGMGFIVVSINFNQLTDNFSDNITRRAILIIEAIRHFQSLHSGSDPIFSLHIDFSKVGFMGHSRGGEAVLIAATSISAGGSPIPGVAPISGVTVKAVVSLAPADWGSTSGPPQNFAFMTILPAGDGDVVGNDGARFYDTAIPSPLKCQLYIHFACHNFFNTEWIRDESRGPKIMSRSDHEKILTAYCCAFFRCFLLGHSFLKALIGKEILPGIKNKNIHLSFELQGLATVDNFEDVDIGVNTLFQPTSQTGGLSAIQLPFDRRIPFGGGINKFFFGKTRGMVAETTAPAGLFRSSLAAETDFTNKEIWIRAAEFYNGSISPTATGFKIGLEDDKKKVAFVDSDDVGGLPRPYDRKIDDMQPRLVLSIADIDTSSSPPIVRSIVGGVSVGGSGEDLTKTMLKTFRFPSKCFPRDPKKLNIKKSRLFYYSLIDPEQDLLLSIRCKSLLSL